MSKENESNIAHEDDVASHRICYTHHEVASIVCECLFLLFILSLH